MNKSGWFFYLGAIMKRHSVLSLLVVGLMVAGVWWIGNDRQGVRMNVPVVKADTRVLAEGVVFPVRYAQMVMPVDGMVGEVLVCEGDRVKAGQSLIRLVRLDYQARVGSARSNIVRSTAAVEQAKINLVDAEREFKRLQQLDDVGAISRQQLDQARTVKERNMAALAQAKAELMNQETQLIEAEKLMDKTELRASMDGTVAFLDIKVGENAASGTILVRILDESAWEVRSDDLTELAVSNIRIGDPVVLTFDAIPGLEIQGKVRFIRPYGEKKRGDITYTVFIAPDSWDARLRWNMTAQIAITQLK